MEITLNTRIYIVTEIESGSKFLIDAGTSAQAIRHVVNNSFSSKVATTKEVAALMADGHTVEQANVPNE